MKNSLIAICCLFFGVVCAAEGTAQTTQKKFSVPCATALQIGLEKVIDRHQTDMKRRYKGATDSGTESEADRAAQQNYLRCRRADNAARLKKLTAAEQSKVKSASKKALDAAQMRVDLINGITFDPEAEDPINYGVTQNAVALVEDFTGALITAHAQQKIVKPTASDEKKFATLLLRLEKTAAAEEQTSEFAAFKKTVKTMLSGFGENEKNAAVKFFIKLISQNLPDEG